MSTCFMASKMIGTRDACMRTGQQHHALDTKVSFFRARQSRTSRYSTSLTRTCQPFASSKMTITIYGPPRSTCTRRVLMTLFEKEVTDFENIPVNLQKFEHKSPEFLEMQPFGVVPVLKDGDVTMFESRAISRYISEKFPDQGANLLGGGSLAERALIYTWMEVEGSTYFPPLRAACYERVIKVYYGGVCDEAVAAVHEEKFGAVLDVYEKHLSNKKYLAGDEFTLADLFHVSYTYLLFTMANRKDFFVASRPNVGAWWERISSRPSWTKTLTLSK